MKKILTILIVLIIIGAVIWKFGSSGVTPTPTAEDTTPLPTSQTVVVSDKLSEYKNDELGFSVKYPTSWERLESPSNVTFSIPTSDDNVKNTIGKLEAKIDIISGNCTFPPVTTIKERSTLKVKDLTFNMISLSNTVQGRSYFNRMYSLQKDSVCYFLTFSAITLSPTNKGYTGAEAQKVGARNLSLVDTADSQFKGMVKSFGFVVGPEGKDEGTISPKK
jgi:hypothetical protein